jgi:hypothetical protein
VGEPVKHPGYLFCMYHNRDANNGLAWLEDDVNLLVRYNDAFLEPDKMRDIINERIDLFGTLASTAEKCSPVVRELSGDLYRRHQTDNYSGCR